jgi:hypothetical protein
VVWWGFADVSEVLADSIIRAMNATFQKTVILILSAVRA